METINAATIIVETTVNASVEKVWQFWTEPKHITSWCQASDDWHAPYADNNLMVAGKFKTTMAAKDGSFSFDFEGVYTRIDTNKAIEYTINDGRKVSINFSSNGSTTTIVKSFDAENTHPIELQKQGWQAI